MVVLYQTQDLVNIAGGVRAMMNMGLRRLRLVQPAEYDEWRVKGIAHGSLPLLRDAELHTSLDSALADAVHVAGTTARRRRFPFPWQQPREAAGGLLELAMAGRGPVVLLFGPEHTGLSNEELDRCDSLLHIPTNPQHPSLNLSHAVLLIAYELWLAGPGLNQEIPRPRRTAPPASANEVERMCTAWQSMLSTVDFFKTRDPEAIMRSLRAIGRRARLDAREAKLLQAVALEVGKVFQRLSRKPPDST